MIQLDYYLTSCYKHEVNCEDTPPRATFNLEKASRLRLSSAQMSHLQSYPLLLLR